MRSLIVASLLALASAQFDMHAAANARRDLQALQARATDDASQSSSRCASAALGIADTIPTPPPAIMSDLLAHPQTDPCHVSLPVSLSSEYASYTREVQSWVSENKGKLQSLASSCEIVSKYIALAPACATSAVASTTKSSGGGSASSGLHGAATGSVVAAGARETGMAGVVLAAAGMAVLAL